MIAGIACPFRQESKQVLRCAKCPRQVRTDGLTCSFFSDSNHLVIGFQHFSEVCVVPDPKRLCLNMIVKNETANLERCPTAVADHFSCWVIGDTGSTEGTQELHQGVLCKAEYSRRAAFVFIGEFRAGAKHCARSCLRVVA
jgi:hypothetical protein